MIQQTNERLPPVTAMLGLPQQGRAATLWLCRATTLFLLGSYRPTYTEDGEMVYRT